MRNADHTGTGSSGNNPAVSSTVDSDLALEELGRRLQGRVSEVSKGLRALAAEIDEEAARFERCRETARLRASALAARVVGIASDRAGFLNLDHVVQAAADYDQKLTRLSARVVRGS